MAKRTPIIPAGAAPNPALSPGIKVGDFLFVSGNVAVDASGKLVGAGDCGASNGRRSRSTGRCWNLQSDSKRDSPCVR